MAKTVRDTRLDTRAARARLSACGKPYWRSIDPGTHLGYRKGKTGGKWLVRWYAGDGRYQEEGIGPADDAADPDGIGILSFAQAQAKARQRAARFAQNAAGLIPDLEKYTVADALQAYLLWMEQHRKSAADARNRAEAFILPTLGTIPINRLTPARIRAWLTTLASQPPRMRTRPGQAQRYRETDHDPDAARKRKATVNRILTTLKAALNLAWREGLATDDSAWRKVKPFPQADAARLRYLTINECQRLMNASPGDLRNLVQAALATGCRHGELAALVIADFNPISGTVHIRQAKSGHGRHVVLTEEGIDLFNRLAIGRPADALLLSPGADLSWTHNRNQRPLRQACQNARIDPPISFHVLRHSYASLAVMAGMPLLVLAQNLGHRDTRMIEKHYGHLAPSYVAEAIRASAPRFGLEPPSNVVTLPVVKAR
ncbi:MAG: site-specific integrase [Candidatus Contendobacter sp.]|nr:site-specific integrase [Candidatus Contendobacter sp.]